MELQGRLEDLRKQELGVAAISYDAHDVLKRFAKERGIRFPLLSDGDSSVIRRFGLLNTVVDEALGPNRDDPSLKADVARYVSAVGVNPRQAGMAFPGTLVVDRRGRVTSRSFETSYAERSTASSLRLKVGPSAEPTFSTRIDTSHLSIVLHASDAVVAPGNRFSLILDITPRRDMHVYAPGVSGYRPIALRLDPLPFVRAESTRFPPSETYVFRPLNETVSVYQRPFRLVQDLVLAGTRDAQAALKGQEALVVTGTLEYQACDDKVCFNPTSVSVGWSLSLRPLER